MLLPAHTRAMFVFGTLNQHAFSKFLNTTVSISLYYFISSIHTNAAGELVKYLAVTYNYSTPLIRSIYHIFPRLE